MRFFLPLSLLLLTFGYAHSQQPAISASHRKATEALMIATNIDQQLKQIPQLYLNTISQSNPGLEPYKDIMINFFERHMSYDKMKDDFIALYAESFSEKELKELVAFYNTPTGKKAIEQLPVLSQKGMELGRRIVEENQDELRLLIQKRAEELAAKQSID